MLASVEADAATKRVTHNANARGRAMQGSETQLGCPRYQIAPEGASADPRSASIGIDLNAVETRSA